MLQIIDIYTRIVGTTDDFGSVRRVLEREDGERVHLRPERQRNDRRSILSLAQLHQVNYTGGRETRSRMSKAWMLTAVRPRGIGHTASIRRQGSVQYRPSDIIDFDLGEQIEGSR